MPAYRAILVTPSCARIERGARLSIGKHPGRSGPVDLKLYTEYATVEGASIPKLLVIEADAAADSMGPALRALIESAVDVAAMIAVAANATVDAPQLDRAYDITAGAPGRDFYKNFGLCFSERERRVREAPTHETEALLRVLLQHPGRDRILRAARQYRLALTYWEPGLETIALAHLYMGVETLAEVALREELSSRGMTEAALAAEWELSDAERGQRLHSNLVSHARRRIIFQRDDATHRKARNASDGFEHGFEDLSEVDALSREVRTTTARYLREALLRLALHDSPALATMLSPPYDFILHAGPPTFELWAELHGAADELAPDGLEHPDVEFTPLPTSVHKVPDGKIEVRHSGVAKW